MAALVSNRVASLGQIVVCQGCCCGRTDRGKPEVPVEGLKAVWRAERLNRTVQLTVSGCLGPCDLTNVAAVILPDEVVWLGRLTTGDDYARLVAWARECHAAGRVVPLPTACDAFRFERFAKEEN